MNIKLTTPVILFAAFLSTVKVKAQAPDYFESSNQILVLRPTLNSSTISVKTTGSDASTPTSRIGVGLGVEYWQKIARTFFVSGGLHYNSFGYKDVRTGYLNVPVIINYLSKSQMLTLGVGAYGGYAISGKYKNSSSDWVKMKYGEAATDNRSRTDAGLIINAGYSLFAIGHLTSYAYIGLKDMTSNGRQDGTTRKMLSWTISYAIPIGSTIFKKKK